MSFSGYATCILSRHVARLAGDGGVVQDAPKLGRLKRPSGAPLADGEYEGARIAASYRVFTIRTVHV